MTSSRQSLIEPGHASETVLLLDIDGTLAPIDADPAAVAVPAATLELLERARTACATVALVTGRTLKEARALVPIDGLQIAALHGMHMLAADGTETLDPIAVSARPELDTACTLAQTVGWRYEDKGLSVTVHFRHVATPEATARQMRAQMVTVLNPLVLEIVDARLALEIRPKHARTKGDAVREIVHATPGAARAIVVGDDVTDLDAFRGLDASGLDITRVAVGSSEAPAALLEAADMVLDSQADVAGLLADLLAPVTVSS